MKISFGYLTSCSVGTLVKAIGHSGITYYAMVGEGDTFIVSCPAKEYFDRRLRHDQVGWARIDLADNQKEKQQFLKRFRG